CKRRDCKSEAQRPCRRSAQPPTSEIISTIEEFFAGKEISEVVRATAASASSERMRAFSGDTI
ncbi:hypothetical protein U1Q18_043912, partial [Sarracenia purpurea var. burkii]